MNKEKLVAEARKAGWALNLAEKNGDIDRFMAKDVRYLIECINKLDELEITEEQAWNKIAESYPADAKSLSVAFEHFYYEGFSKKELPVIPQFVADWIELAKEVGLSLVGVMDLDTITIHKTYPKVEFQKLKDYMSYGKNQKKVARAWLDGYEVEKEKLYRVRAGKSYVRFNLDGSIVGAKAVNSVVTLDRLSNLPFDYKKAVESGIITLVEVTE